VTLLAHHFTRRWAEAYGRPGLRLSEGALDRLRAHAWPGNVRELENAIHRAVIEAAGDELEAGHMLLDPLIGAPVEGSDGMRQDPGRAPVLGGLAAVGAASAPTRGRSWDEVQRDLIFSTLAQVGGNRRRAAELIGIGERTLRNRLREYREGAKP
jgi:DNA-binding NtrC family response regulator